MKVEKYFYTDFYTSRKTIFLNENNLISNSYSDYAIH